ncbi:MAG: gliding motility-associated C-terminal domain-containing protein [Bacteroidetes bacterium]|nr:gliding motility-associated C-terminal domain-containing protein [Bacteroidota bacterium]
MNTKKIFPFLIAGLLSANYVFCFKKNMIGKNQSENLNSTVGFIENKGQILDQHHKPVNEVKFLLNSVGINTQIKTNGFSYDTYTDNNEDIQVLNKWLKRERNDVNTSHPGSIRRNVHRIDIEFIGSMPNVEVTGTDALPGYSVYYTSGVRTQAQIKSYGTVTYHDLYPHIDMVYKTGSGSEKGAEYYFIVRPGGDASQIRMRYSGANNIIAGTDNLKLSVTHGVLTERIPASYISETKQQMSVVYKQAAENEFCFSIPSYDKTKTLVIDPGPGIDWATYYGDSGNEYGMDVAWDNTNSMICMLGFTSSPSNIATTGAHQTTLVNGADNFVLKMNSGGTRQWCTYFGGNDWEGNWGGIRTDNSGNIYFVGETSSTDLSTPGVWQTAFNTANFGMTDGFVAKLNSAGARQWCTYYGGDKSDEALNVVPDNTTGEVYVCGRTTSTTAGGGIASAGAFQTTFGGGCNDAFVAKFNSSATSCLWGTYFGDTNCDDAWDIAIDAAAANIFITGYTQGPTNTLATAGAYLTSYQGGPNDAFIAKFSSTGIRVACTYYGGDKNDNSRGLALDGAGDVYITGWTQSVLPGPNTCIASPGSYQPALNGTNDAYLAKLNNSLTSRLWGTYYGGVDGGQTDIGEDVACDSSDNVYLCGYSSYNSALNTTGCPYRGSTDIFLAMFDSSGTRQWSTYYGGTQLEIEPHIKSTPAGDIYMCGWTSSSDYISTPGAFQAAKTNPSNSNSYEAFLVKFGGTTPCITNVTCSGQPVATFSYTASPYCQNAADPSPVYSGGGTAGTFTSTPGLSINPVTGIINLNTSTPGTYTVTNSIPASGGCSAATATSGIIITAQPVATFSYTGSPYCQNATDPSPVFSGGGIAGTFTSTSGLNINAGTGTINLTTSTPGTYTVTNTIAAAGGCPQVSSTASVTIDPIQNAAFNFSSSTYCQSGANPLPNITGVTSGTFNSSPAGLIFTNTTTGEINLSASSLNTYTVTYTTAGPCANSSTATITITNAPIATFGYTASPYCQNAADPSPVYSGGGTAGSFTSTPGLSINSGTGSINLNTSTPGTYTVTNTIAASGGCPAVTATATITITTQPIATFSYTGSPYCQNSTDPSPVFSGGGTAGTFTSTPGLNINSVTGTINLNASIPGTYTVTNTIAASGGCPATTATSSITITAQPVATFGYTASPYCQNAANPSPVYSGGGIAGSFTSTPGLSINSGTGTINLSASTPGTYTVTNTIPASSGCSTTTATSTITIIAAQSGTFNYSLSSFCKGSANPFPVFTGGSIAGIFSSTPGLTINGNTGEIDLSTSSPGTYIVTNTIPPANGCPATTETSSITVVATPVITVSSLTICSGQTGTLSASGAASYTWSTGNTTNNISINPTASTTYTVSGTTSGCMGSSTVTVIVNPKPIATVASTPLTPIGGGVTLTASGGIVYSWNPSSGLSCSTCAVTIASPIITTQYCVTVSDSTGCSDTYCITADIKCGDIFVPNAFSPNNDSQNDIFYVMGHCIQEFRFSVFDRWGENVFETTDHTKGWDGTYKGEKLDPALFVYYLKAKVNGSDVNKHGTITLVK